MSSNNIHQTSNHPRTETLRKLAPLSLAGALLFAAGCKEPTLHEKVEKRARPSVGKIIADPASWKKEEVTIEGLLTPVSSHAVIKTYGKTMLRVVGTDRYLVRQVAEGVTNQLTAIHEWTSPSYRKIHAGYVQESSAQFKLRPSTYIVTGRLEQFSDSPALYLSIDGSYYR